MYAARVRPYKSVAGVELDILFVEKWHEALRDKCAYDR